MVNEWTIDDLPTKFDDSRFPRHPWNPSPYLMADLAVWLNEHHPKPAREVTRDDLPDFGAMGSVMARWKVSYGAVSGVLDAVVSHLNANGGLPADDRWRRAHEIVEQERDQARESLREACKVAQSYKVDAYQATERAEAAERERDEWRDRAERFRDAIRSHPSMRGTVGMSGGTDDDFVVAVNAQLDQLSDDAEKWMVRAENAEWGMEHPAERFVPAVDRDKLARSIAHAVHAKGGLPVEEYTTDVVMKYLKSCESKFEGAQWSNAGLEAEARRRTEALRQNLHGVEVARDEWKARAEAAELERDEALEGSALFQRDVHAWRTRAEAAEARTAVTREDVEAALAQEHRMAFGMPVVSIDVALETVCSLFGVEAEPADPVAQKAAELFGAAFPGEAFDQHPHVTQEPWINAARYVLGQETGQ